VQAVLAGIAEGGLSFRAISRRTGVAVTTVRAIAHRNGVPVQPKYETMADRFWAKVNRDGPVPAHRPELGPCWIWTAGKSSHGYGSFGDGERIDRSHRVSYRMAYGPLVPGQVVCHRCDNPPCVNPAHLFAGSALDNARDKVGKGRSGPRLMGEAHLSAKLTAEQVVAIRERLAAGESQSALAREHGVTVQSIHAIAHYRSWRDLPTDGTATQIRLKANAARRKGAK
jgi:hypothetical protein